MPKYDVDTGVAVRVANLARRDPFENLSFNDAVLRLVERVEGLLNAAKTDTAKGIPLSSLVSGIEAFSQVVPVVLDASNPQIPLSQVLGIKKAPSPSATEWVASVPELNPNTGDLTTWTAICNELEIETKGDSARRVLQKWVAENKPEWPKVPDVAE